MVVPNTTTMAHRVSTEIESVTSNSKTDEEEQEEQEEQEERSSQHSSDNDDNNDNTLPRTANETVTSPDPAPIKGGDDEVLRFSHVASIVVKEAVIMEPEKNKRSSSPGVEGSMGRGVGRNRYSTGTTSIQRTDGNESEADNCKPMDVIMKSPYEPSLNAEKGIKVFTDMRSLLSESSHDNYRTVDPKAAKVFGPTNAWCLVKANALIDKSGMVYSQEWVNGNIRGNLIGKMPKDMLLLCLVAKRFVKAGELLLMGLIRDLEVCSLVQDAIKEWNLEDEYPKIASCPQKTFSFNSKKRDTYKCVIFVGRAYSCTKAFGVFNLDGDLLAKVRTCLDIIESRLPEGSSKKRKLKLVEPAPAPVAAPPPVIAATFTSPTPLAKKRRGRPPKSRTPPESVVETKTLLPEAEPVHEEEIIRAVASSSTRVKRSKNGKKQPMVALSVLVSRFEEQYTQMGEMYRQMGETLADVKAKINENRESTEQEIRSELLQEVQKTIMSSFPKK